MPPPNPRTLKFKAIIKDYNKQETYSASRETEKENLPLNPATNENSISSTVSQPIQSSNPGQSSHIYKIQENEKLPLNDETNNVQLRYRRSSCSSDFSCSNEESDKDFSPASDDDKEYKPPSLIDSSSSNDGTPRRAIHKKNKTYLAQPCNSLQKTSPPVKVRLPGTSGSSESSSGSSNSSSTTSNSGSNTSSESDSDSKSSLKSDSCHNSTKENDVTPPTAKIKRYRSPIELLQPQTSSILLQIAENYPSSSDSEDNNSKLCVTVSTSDGKQQTNHFSEKFQNGSTADSQVLESLNSNKPLPLKVLAQNFIDKMIETTQKSYLPTCSAQNVPMSDGEIVQENTIELGQETPYLNEPLPLKVLALKIVNFLTNTTQQSDLSICPSTVCQSCSNGDALSPKKSRKRKRGTNKRALAQRLRNMGLPYTSTSNALIPARKMGNPCGDRCRLKCKGLFSEDQRQLVFERYWNIGSLTKQRDFISKHITEIKPKYQYKKIDSNRKSKHAFYLTVDGKRLRVCKIYFKNTLGINDRPIRTVIDKLNSSGIVEPEQRGKHDNHHKVPGELLDGVRRHINSIPRIESHYLRKQTEREFIDGGKSISDLYTDYKNDCEATGSDYVKIHTYRKIFNEEFNIGFFVPKKDQCGDCITYKNAEPEEKEKLEETHRIHLEEKEKIRDEKLKDKENVGEKNIVACYDLQAVLQVPKGEANQFYYKSRLNCFNFTISELKTDHHECFFWTEVEGQRGANEIGSCVLRYLQDKSTASPETLDIIFYSDNCCGQQKNQFIFSMYIYAVKNLANVQSVTHKFLIKGHTQNEGDSVHSTIEKQIKKNLKSGPIYVPDQYINAIRVAKKRGNKYKVKEMSHCEFYDVKSLQEYKLSKNTEGQAVRINTIKVIKIEKAEGECDGVRVLYKTSHLEETFKEIKLQKQARARPQLKQLYSSRLPLAENKKKDLKTLIRERAIPLYYASSFYNSILN